MEKQAITDDTELCIDDPTLDAMDGIFLGIERAKGLLAVLKDGLFNQNDPVAEVPYSAKNLINALDTIDEVLAGAYEKVCILDQVRMANIGSHKGPAVLSN